MTQCYLASFVVMLLSFRSYVVFPGKSDYLEIALRF